MIAFKFLSLKRSKLLVFSMIACLFSGPAFADFEFMLENPQGGNEGVSTFVTGEYDAPYTVCGMQIYANRRSVTRVNTHFASSGQLVRKSNRQVVCRWGNW